jgi:hypothetical protein
MKYNSILPILSTISLYFFKTIFQKYFKKKEKHLENFLRLIIALVVLMQICHDK